MRQSGRTALFRMAVTVAVVLEICYGSVFGRPADRSAIRPADGKDFAGYMAYTAIYRKSKKIHQIGEGMNREIPVIGGELGTVAGRNSWHTVGTGTECLIRTAAVLRNRNYGPQNKACHRFSCPSLFERHPESAPAQIPMHGTALGPLGRHCSPAWPSAPSLHRLGSSVEVALDSEISEARRRFVFASRPSAGCAPAARQIWGAGLQDSFAVRRVATVGWAWLSSLRTVPGHF